ncbi:hypothetical protein CN446_11385 [Bacillus cereus]|nr:hypothetical protein CN446_11385 [Bacillus cereus]PGU51271.1 hypothetical protein COD70_27285 [Bacillus cereus]
MFDSTDFKIIKLLQENARMNWKEIGEIVHLTGQAVGKRINKLEETLADVLHYGDYRINTVIKTIEKKKE